MNQQLRKQFAIVSNFSFFINLSTKRFRNKVDSKSNYSIIIFIFTREITINIVTSIKKIIHHDFIDFEKRQTSKFIIKNFILKQQRIIIVIVN